MSQWQDYGYPRLSGVSFQTALHGLVCALRERLQAETVNHLAEYYALDFCEKVNAFPIYTAVRRIEEIFNRMTNFLLPDGTAFSPENAAAYLQEELVLLTAKVDRSYWSCPWSDLMYEWLMQRYRFLNLAYQVSAMSFYSDSIREYWSGSGESMGEAAGNLELDSSVSGYSAFSGAVISSVSGSSWNVEKIFYVPCRIRYPFAVSGQVRLEINPQMSRTYCGYYSWERESTEFTVCPDTDQCLKWQRDDLGVPMTFNTWQSFFEYRVSDDQELPSTIELPELSNRILAYLHKAQLPSPPAGFKNGRTVRGFETQCRWICDFRNSFKFYDPADRESAV